MLIRALDEALDALNDAQMHRYEQLRSPVNPHLLIHVEPSIYTMCQVVFWHV